MRAHPLRAIAPLFAVLSATACAAGDDGDLARDVLAQAEAPALQRATTPSEANVPALAAGNRDFAFALYQRLAAAEPDANLFFSPYSVSSALAMVYAGARGENADEIGAALRFSLSGARLHEAFNAVDLALASRGQGERGADGSPFRLKVANALWARHGAPVVPEFLETLAVNYGSTLYREDFARDAEGSRRRINAWVAERTEQRVPELLHEHDVGPGTDFVLTNAVHFNAGWATAFNPTLTRDRPFTRLDGTEVRAKMMQTFREGERPVARGDGYVATALPYAGEQLSLIAVLPAEGAFERVQRALSGAWFEALRARLAPELVRLSFPKFGYEARASLVEPLRELGMKRAFGSGADFSGMTDLAIAVGDVIHQARVEVTEGGTIAAAATAVVTTYAPAPPALDFDRPFLYAIVDAPTGQILFLGRVLDPTK